MGQADQNPEQDVVRMVGQAGLSRRHRLAPEGLGGQSQHPLPGHLHPGPFWRGGAVRLQSGRKTGIGGRSLGPGGSLGSGAGLRVRSVMDQPDLPEDGGHQLPAPDTLLRRFLRGQLGEYRTVSGRLDSGIDSVSRSEVPADSEVLRPASHRWFDWWLGGARLSRFSSPSSLGAPGHYIPTGSIFPGTR